mmetsp:Transcript_7636/g.10726  ORF Transcript_7636/g.10726 Transcript_7636/m.10726 type:complete len:282 (+) Transcript_7636:164-1009(+)
MLLFYVSVASHLIFSSSHSVIVQMPLLDLVFIFEALMFIVSTIVTIVKNERRWNSIKYAATFVGAVPAGYIVVGSLVKLRILLVNAQASMKKLQEKTEEILDRKTKSRANATSKLGLCREPTEIEDSKPEREMRVQLNQVSDSNVKTKHNGESSSCGDHYNPILPTKSSRTNVTSKEHSFTGSNQATRSLERNNIKTKSNRDRIVRRTTVKLDRLISVGLLVVLAAIAFSVFAFIATATSNEAYTNFADEQSRDYSILSDIGSYVISIGILSYGIWYMATA